MKKLVATLLMVPMILAAPLTSDKFDLNKAVTVNAAGVTDVLEFMGKPEVTNTLIELVKVKQEIKSGNKDALQKRVAKEALEQLGISGDANDLIVSSYDEIRKSMKSVKTPEGKEMLKQIAEEYVKDKVRAEVAERVSPIIEPYQEQILILATLFDLDDYLYESDFQDDYLNKAPKKYKKVLNMKSTAYAPGPLDNGIWGDKTYVGGTVKKGVVAVDPKVIPMGTKVFVEGYGEAVAADQGSAIKGNRIDLAFNTRQEALDYGIQDIKVYVLE